MPVARRGEHLDVTDRAIELAGICGIVEGLQQLARVTPEQRARGGIEGLNLVGNVVEQHPVVDKLCEPVGSD